MRSYLVVECRHAVQFFISRVGKLTHLKVKQMNASNANHKHNFQQYTEREERPANPREIENPYLMRTVTINAAHSMKVCLNRLREELP